MWVAIYFVKKSELHPGAYLIAGRGCGWRNLVVSQLFANSRASHCGCGQVQEPGVDRQQDDCRLDTSIIGTNLLIGWLWKTSDHAVLALLALWLWFLFLVCVKCAHFCIVFVTHASSQIPSSRCISYKMLRRSARRRRPPKGMTPTPFSTKPWSSLSHPTFCR